jgi:hypothetical protein
MIDTTPKKPKSSRQSRRTAGLAAPLPGKPADPPGQPSTTPIPSGLECRHIDADHDLPIWQDLDRVDDGRIPAEGGIWLLVADLITFAELLRLVCAHTTLLAGLHEAPTGLLRSA